MNTKYWLALNSVPRLGPNTFQNILARFGKPEKVFKVSIEELCVVPRLSQTMAEHILGINLDAVELEIQSLDEEGIEVITLKDDEYPQNLKQISDAPPVLFKMGKFQEQDNQAVAIIGTRKPSKNGLNCAKYLAKELASRGFTIVSGLALGIDTAAHEGALDANGRTIGVLGSGIRVIHPRRNQELSRQVISNGALISELQPDAPPSPANLMSRDRITSGLALGTIVVEAQGKSGSMDTANRTQKQNRVLFVVDNNSDGNVKLLQEGAIPISGLNTRNVDMIVEKLKVGVDLGNKSNQLEFF